MNFGAHAVAGRAHQRLLNTAFPLKWRNPRNIRTTFPRYLSSNSPEPSGSEIKVPENSRNIYHSVFRVMRYSGELLNGWEPPFTEEECIERYTFMLRLSVYDRMLCDVQRQGRIPFYLPNQGEECLQTAIADALDPSDQTLCQYRELGVIVRRGFTLENILDQLFGSSDDPGKGRQMPICYTKKEIGLQTISAPLATQISQGVGCGYAFKLNGEKRAAVTLFGEGAASEGDFAAGLGLAVSTQSQTIFICRNNGYAISTPVSEQYSGDGIAIRGVACGMDTIRVDGNDYFACYIAAKKAWDLCVHKSKPVLIECMTYRLGNHSTSDTAEQYRPSQEVAAWSRPGVSGLCKKYYDGENLSHFVARFRRFLGRNHLWDEGKEERLKANAKKGFLNEVRRVQHKKALGIISGMFEDVYDTQPWNLKEQQEELREHLRKNAKYYDLSKYGPSQ